MRPPVLIARAPFRVSFAGGGTDLAAYYRSFGGLVVSTAISRHIYVMLRPGRARSPVHLITVDGGTYTHVHVRDTAEPDGATHLPRAVLRYFGVTGGIELFIASEIPSGTGLGSSSALVVALIHAVSAYLGRSLRPADVAELACAIEIEHLGLPIGKQDQYASAIGGLNAITFSATGVRCRPLRLARATRERLEDRLQLFYTGTRRDANTILGHQTRASEERKPQTLAALHALKHIAEQTIVALERGDLDAFGDLLHEGWMHKQRLTHGISNPFIDQCYETARSAGARGGKITGAGGGGFLLLDCPPERTEAVTNSLLPLGLQHFPFVLEDEPAGIVAGAGMAAGAQREEMFPPVMVEALTTEDKNGSGRSSQLSL
ncbi:MAG TPA: GHMP kinase [Chloroflexota bacterium]|nr:GHMP kinase [Chloroflexota bacterium]